MSRLQCVYLMNVALYLKLSDIPLFVKINHKTKDACVGLRINPINNDDFDLKLSLKIINSFFPRLETLYLTKQAFETLSSVEYRNEIPNVEIFKSNDFVDLGKIGFCERISERIDKVSINFKIFIQPPLKQVKSIKAHFFCLSYLKRPLKEIQSLKRIYLIEEFYDLTDGREKIEQINKLAKDFEVILSFRTHTTNKFELIEQLIKLLDESIIVNYKFNYGINEYYKQYGFPQTKDDFDGDLWFKRIKKEYYPSQLVIRDKTHIDYLSEFENVTKVKFFVEGKYKLPSHVETIESQCYNDLIINNWEELNEVKSIVHSDYNINTPLYYRKLEKNSYKKINGEIFIFGLIRIFTIPLLFVYTSFNAALFSYENLLNAISQYIFISLMAYSIFIIFIAFKELTTHVILLIGKYLIIGVFLVIIQYLGVLTFNLMLYELVFAKILLKYSCVVAFFFMDLLVILLGFEKGYTKRIIFDYLPFLLNSFLKILQFFDNLIQGRIAFCSVFLFLSTALVSCFIQALFTSKSLLFILNLINSIITIAISFASIYLLY